MVLEDLEDLCNNFKKNEIVSTQEIMGNLELARVLTQSKEITVKLYWKYACGALGKF